MTNLPVARWLSLAAEALEETRLPGSTSRADLADSVQGAAEQTDDIQAGAETVTLAPGAGIDSLPFDLVFRTKTEPQRVLGLADVKWCALGANTLHESIWDAIKVALAVEDAACPGYLIAAAPAYFWTESSIPSIFEPGLYAATDLLAQRFTSGIPVWERLLASGYAKYPDAVPSAINVKPVGFAHVNWSPVDWELRAIAITPRGSRLQLSRSGDSVRARGASTQITRKQTPGRAFEHLVGELYRSLGYQVTHNVQLPGKQTDLLARRSLAGSTELTLAIECKDQVDPVGNADVIHFVATIIKHREAKAVTSGALVSRSGFTADARAAAASHDGVVLLSWDELTAEVLDIGPQVRAISEGYEHKAIFSEYMALRAAQTSWGNLTTPSHATTTSTEVVRDWIARAEQPGGATSLIVLADFGAGKTTLVERVEYERARAFASAEDHRIPLRVSLRGFRDTHDLRTMLRASLRDRYVRDVPAEILWEKIEQGQFYVLLDGFDEMIDRSDAARRAELFHALLPVLRSPCPTLLTSRPSYFLEEGELEDLLTTIRTTEREIAVATGPIQAKGSAAGDRIRRRLVNRRRETQPPGRDADPFGSKEVEVVVLLPLDRAQIEAYISSRTGELAQVEARPEDVVEFIDRTYDLADLASRPLLLTLIIDSVLDGVLDVADTTTRYGASELYEIYTQAKLDIDLTKGPLHQRGLSAQARCHLVERLALEMYKAGSLELDLLPTLGRILDESPDLNRNGLTDREVATDFATCTFVTLADHGGCRFVHKSFRGFFIARAISKSFDRLHPMLQDWLEQEVLYFLGGFGPTRPHVTEALWARFLHTDRTKRTLRRNLLVAYLYTTPDHDSRKIAAAEIVDAKYGKLTFNGTRLRDVKWSACEVTELALREALWKRVTFEVSQVKTLDVRGSNCEVEWDRAWGERLNVEKSRVQIQLKESKIDAISASESLLAVAGATQAAIGALTASDSHVSLAFNVSDAVGEVDLQRSYLEVSSACISRLDASRSIVVLGSRVSAPTGWRLTASLIRLARGDKTPQVRGGRHLGVLDEECVVISDLPLLVAQLNEMSCGVFGKLDPQSLASATRTPACWGIMDAGQLLDRQSPSIVRLNRIILVSSPWFTTQSSAGGRLEPFVMLTALAQAQPYGRPPTKRLETLMRAAQATYEELAAAADVNVRISEDGALEATEGM